MAEDTRSQAYWQATISSLTPLTPNFVWWNPLNKNSLRLTKAGLAIIPKKDFKYHTINVGAKLLPAHFLLLERAMPAPYYIKKLDQLYVFDETVAIMLTLHAGDLGSCLSNMLKYG